MQCEQQPGDMATTLTPNGPDDIAFVTALAQVFLTGGRITVETDATEKQPGTRQIYARQTTLRVSNV